MLKSALRQPLIIQVVALLIALYGRLVFATSRVRVITPLPPELTQKPVLYALWHQHIFAVPLFHKHNPAPLLGLMSASRDGTLTRAIAAHYHIGSIVGSSSKGAVSAVRHLIRATRPSSGPRPSLFLTPDGPRGPAQLAKPGATEVARLTHLPLIPVAAWCTRGHTFASWDKFRIPYPFTTFFIAFGAAMPQTTPEHLTRTLNTLTTQAKAASTARQPPSPTLG